MSTFTDEEKVKFLTEKLSNLRLTLQHMIDADESMLVGKGSKESYTEQYNSEISVVEQLLENLGYKP